MKKTWKTLVAGIVGLVVGIPVTVLYPVYLLVVSLSGRYVNPAALLIMLIGLPAIVGGLLAFRRRMWLLALVAMIFGIPAGHLSFLGLSVVLDWIYRLSDIEMDAVPFFGSAIVTAAAVLIGLSRSEFTRPVTDTAGAIS